MLEQKKMGSKQKFVYGGGMAGIHTIFVIIIFEVSSLSITYKSNIYRERSIVYNGITFQLHSYFFNNFYLNYNV